MKVAISASYHDIPAVAELLGECDFIFTTQVENRDELWKRFGRDRVKFIPDSTGKTIKYVKEKFSDDDVKFIEWSDIRALVRFAVLDGDVETIRKVLPRCGWFLDQEGPQNVWRKNGVEPVPCDGDEIPRGVIESIQKSF